MNLGNSWGLVCLYSYLSLRYLMGECQNWISIFTRAKTELEKTRERKFSRSLTILCSLSVTFSVSSRGAEEFLLY